MSRRYISLIEKYSKLPQRKIIVELKKMYYQAQIDNDTYLMDEMKKSIPDFLGGVVVSQPIPAGITKEELKKYHEEIPDIDKEINEKKHFGNELLKNDLHWLRFYTHTRNFDKIDYYLDSVIKDLNFLKDSEVITENKLKKE